MKLKNTTNQKIYILSGIGKVTIYSDFEGEFICIKPGESLEMSILGLEEEEACENCGAE